MVHVGQHLALRLEADDKIHRVHPQLDDLQCDPPLHPLQLLRGVDNPESALANLFLESVPADHRPLDLGVGRLRTSTSQQIPHPQIWHGRHLVQEPLCRCERRKHRSRTLAQGRIPDALLV